MKGKGAGLLLLTIGISMFLDGLDGTIVNVALPTISDSFGIDIGDTSWIVTVYFLVMAGLILIFGRICDMGALKRVLIAGLSVFTIGSFLCGISPNLTMLIVCRAIQGLGGAMLASSAVMIGVKYLPREKLALGMSLVVIGSSIGMAIGPTMGAILTEFFSWHWIFFINVPVGIAAVIIASMAVPKDEGFERGDVDIIGSIILFLAIVLGLFAIERVPSEGLNGPSTVSLILSVILLVVFVIYERGKAGSVLKLSLFRNMDFVEMTLVYMLVSVAIMGLVYLIPFMFRTVLGFDTLMTGLILSIQAISLIACSVSSVRLSKTIGNRILTIISAVMQILFAIMLAMIGADTSIIFVSLTILVCGTVWGIGGGPMGSRMVSVLGKEDRGAGSSVLSFIMYFASALGTALFAGLFGFRTGTGSIESIPADVFQDGIFFCCIIAVILGVASVLMAWHVRSDEED